MGKIGSTIRTFVVCLCMYRAWWFFSAIPTILWDSRNPVSYFVLPVLHDFFQHFQIVNQTRRDLKYTSKPANCSYSMFFYLRHPILQSFFAERVRGSAAEKKGWYRASPFGTHKTHLLWEFSYGYLPANTTPALRFCEATRQIDCVHVDLRFVSGCVLLTCFLSQAAPFSVEGAWRCVLKFVSLLNVTVVFSSKTIDGQSCTPLFWMVYFCGDLCGKWWVWWRFVLQWRRSLEQRVKWLLLRLLKFFCHVIRCPAFDLHLRNTSS